MAKENAKIPSPQTSEYDNLLALKKKEARKANILNVIPLYLMMLPGLIYLVCNIMKLERIMKY